MELTPTQERLMNILQDGHPHPVAQLWAALDDELSVASNLQAHISYLRKKLSRIGQGIVCEQRGGSHYRLVRHLSSSDE